jgi:hypothetical protein
VSPRGSGTQQRRAFAREAKDEAGGCGLWTRGGGDGSKWCAVVFDFSPLRGKRRGAEEEDRSPRLEIEDAGGRNGGQTVDPRGRVGRSGPDAAQQRVGRAGCAGTGIYFFVVKIKEIYPTEPDSCLARSGSTRRHRDRPRRVARGGR